MIKQSDFSPGYCGLKSLIRLFGSFSFYGLAVNLS